MTNVIALGPPPVTEEAADRALDLVDFMASVVRGVDVIDVTPAMRDHWRSYLAAHYPSLSAPERTWYATAHTALAHLQANWSGWSDEQRSANRKNWAMALPTVLQFAQPVLQHGGAVTAPSTTPTGPHPPSSIGGLIASLQEGQEARAQEAFEIAGGGEAGKLAMARIQAENQRLNMEMLTEMSKLRYEAMMGVWKK